jgi:chemotaxis family two-component system response regulator Rcp1
MSTPHNSINVLIAEDEETDAFFFEKALGQSKLDIKVHIVKDGQEVMDFLKRKEGFVDAPRPNFVIMDLNMPLKSGHDALAEIKGDEALRKIPVIVMSASTEQADIDMAYGLHANAYVPKTNGMEDMNRFVSSIEQFWFMQAILPQGDSKNKVDYYFITYKKRENTKTLMKAASFSLLLAAFLVTSIIFSFTSAGPIILGSEMNTDGMVEYMCLGNGCENMTDFSWSDK